MLVDIVKSDKYGQMGWYAVDHDDPLYAEAIKRHEDSAIQDQRNALNERLSKIKMNSLTAKRLATF